jgi:hypothetical protein
LLRTLSDVRMSGYDIEQINCITLSVTFGVTREQQGFASESGMESEMSDAAPKAHGVKPIARIAGFVESSWRPSLRRFGARRLSH